MQPEAARTPRWPWVAVRVFTSIVTLVLLALSTLHLPWGYDEYGPVVSHIEIDDPAFVDEYVAFMETVCPQCPNMRSLLTHIVLPIFVVPIRWTYALGISPWLGLARIVDLDWPILKPLLLMPSVLLAGLGLWLAMRAAAARGVGPGAQLTFLGLVTASPALFWWINSFSSYAHHLFCFGLLTYASLVVDEGVAPRLMGRAALMRAVAPVLNYQYVPVVVMLWLMDLMRDPRGFVAKRRWLGWCAAGMSCVATIAFLIARTSISGKHGSPTTAALTAEQAQLFSFTKQAHDISSALEVLAGRYGDIAVSFYAPDTGAFTSLGPVASALYIGLVLLVILLAWQLLDRLLFEVLAAMLLATVMLHLTDVMPLSPSRHQLVMFAPLCLFAACLLERLMGPVLSARALPAFAIVGIIAALIYQAAPLMRPDRGMPVQGVRAALEEGSVQRLVLAPCELEPMLYPDLRNSYAPLYRCGPRVVNVLPHDVNTIAVWSGRDLPVINASIVVGDFSRDQWRFRFVPLPESNWGVRGSLYIAERINLGANGTNRP